MTRKDLTFRVFVSSTFSDLIEERNALQRETFKNLRAYCAEKGARFQAIDLRWGVGKEAALDQQTMNVCMQELHRCQELSPRPNFIVLLGQRYGWVPLPPQIDAKEFDEILSNVPPENRGLLSDWYRLDENAVPPQYDLRPREGSFREQGNWDKVEAQLKKVLLPAVEQTFDKDDPKRVKYFASATAQEIYGGALSVDDADRHVFCYFRDIKGLPEDASATGYRDLIDGTVDQQAKTQLEELKEELAGKLPAEHVDSWPSEWKNGAPVTNLKALCEAVERDLKRIIDSELDAFERAPELERERSAHKEFGERRSVHFEGRQDAIQLTEAYCKGEQNSPLFFFGKSGCGKTALMAKISEMVGDWMPEDSAVVKRFIGATPQSTDLRPLLRSLCEDIAEIYERTGDDAVEIPQDVNELLREFAERLAWASETKPLVILLDALDQLAPGDSAHQLYWLPTELPPHVKLVASVLERDDEAGACLEAARRRFPESLHPIRELSPEHGATVLDAWLKEAGRTLRPEQRNDILSKFEKEGLPLYLKLGFEEVRRWKSYDGLPCGADKEEGLGEDIKGILDDLFWRLELPQHHGELLVTTAMQYLRTARRGLTEDELIDILSMNEPDNSLSAVLEDYHKRSPDSPEVDTLPIVVWSRLLADLEPYLVQRETYGANVWNFYHRQVGEAVEANYLSGDTKGNTHRRLADYFQSLDYWMESLEDQRARAKRLPPTPRPANIRKVDELPHHLLETAKQLGGDDATSPHWDAVADLLTHWEFLEAKAEAQP